MLKKRSSKRAFSLIELSIVVVIIGILIAGVIQGSKLYAKFKLQTGRQLTKSSPVAGIKDLALWLETTLEESFISSEAVDGNSISTWYDTNPQSQFKVSVTQPTNGSYAAQQPTFKENVINGLPVVRFNESFLSTNFFFDASTAKTIFVVVTDTDSSGGQILNVAPNRFYFSVAASSSNITFRFLTGNPGYETFYIGGKTAFDGVFHLASLTIGPVVSSGITNYTATVHFDGNNIDGDNNPISNDIGGGNLKIGTASSSTASIHLFSGDIAEIIIYNRMLSDEERLAVQEYLKKKFSLRIS